MSVAFDTALYAFAHGHAPRGHENIPHSRATQKLMRIFSHSTMHGDAKKAAVEAK